MNKVTTPAVTTNPVAVKPVPDVVQKIPEVSDDSNESKQDIDAILRKHNLTVDDLIKCGKRGLTATRVTKDRYGDITDEVPDYNVQHKFFATFLELMGMLKQSQINVQVNQISAAEKELLEAYKNNRISNGV